MSKQKEKLSSAHLKFFQTIGPGPGGYNPVNQNSSPQYTIKNKYEIKQPDSYLAPNYYQPQDSYTKHSAPQYSIKVRTGTSLDAPKEKILEPSPNFYQPRFEYTTKRSPSPTLKSRQPISNQNQVPGPGTYKQIRQDSAPSFSLRSRPQAKEPQVTPGPGQYSPQRGSSSPQFTLRGKHNEYLGEQLLIGPGSYDVSRKDYGRAALFAGRTYINSTWETPGPGTYTAEAPKNHSPQYSLAGRYEQKISSESPGPIYNVHTEYNGPSYSIKGRHNNQKPSFTPGPGAYHQEIKRPTSGYNMNDKQKRMTLKVDTNPAPNAYSLNSNVYRGGAKSQAGSYIGVKYNTQKESSTPGPGAYNANYAVFNKKSQASIGKKYNEAIQNTGPGAGAYNPRPQTASPSFTIRPKTNIGRGGF